jgi:amino acid transporter
MIATTIMAVVMLTWSVATLAVRGPVNPWPTWQPDLTRKVEVDPGGHAAPKINPITGEQEDPLGWVGRYPSLAEPLRRPGNWLSLIGAVGIVIAFGHSILAMSGEETLAQVYREVEAPKLRNFKRAALVVFVYSLLLTGTFNFLATLLVPDSLRMTRYYDNWIGGLAMQMIGPVSIRLLLNGFVVLVGFLILSGAVNTSIVGSNGVLSRVAEDGVLPDWFLRPHPRLGTNYRLLYLIAGLQIATILASRGDVILLGEAYAFGVVWSFVFKTLSMVVLRFKDRSPREFRVPFNVRCGSVELPVGLGAIFLIVLLSALANLATKPAATVSGLAFTFAFLSVFIVTEQIHHRRRHSGKHEHLEQFNQAAATQATAESLGLTRPYRKLVAIRSPQNLFMLDKALADADPQSTDVVVMTAKVRPRGAALGNDATLDAYDQHLLTAVVNHAEQLGKPVRPLLVPTNNALHAVLNTAKELQARELVIGASNKYTAEEQLDQIAFYWINLNEGGPVGLTVHIIGNDRRLSFDLHGGNRIPTADERLARSVGDLRAAGVGIQRVLFLHDGAAASHDVFEWLLTMLASEISLDVVAVAPPFLVARGERDFLDSDRRWAAKLGRAVNMPTDAPQSGPQLVQLAFSGNYDLLVAPERRCGLPDGESDSLTDYLRQHAPCGVLFARHPVAPREPAAA